MLANLKVRDRPTFAPSQQSSSTHLMLAKLDQEKVEKDSFLQFLMEKGMKNNFLFWSEAYDMLGQINAVKKIKQVFELYNKYLKEGAEMGLRLKSNFRYDLSYFIEQNKIISIEDIPYQLFLNLLIEIEISLSEIVDTYVNMFI